MGAGLAALLVVSALQEWAGRRQLGFLPTSIVGAATGLLLLVPLLIRAAAAFKRGDPLSQKRRLGLSTGVVCFYVALVAFYFSFVWGIH